MSFIEFEFELYPIDYNLNDCIDAFDCTLGAKIPPLRSRHRIVDVDYELVEDPDLQTEPHPMLITYSINQPTNINKIIMSTSKILFRICFAIVIASLLSGIILKLLNVITLPWWMIFAPAWGGILFYLLGLGILTFCVMFVLKLKRR